MYKNEVGFVNDVDQLKKSTEWLKRRSTAILIVLLLTGVAVAALITLSKTAKQKYFDAENSSFEFVKNAFDEKYTPEITWQQQIREKPAKSTYTLSANLEDYSNDYYMFNPTAIINHSSLLIETESDFNKKKHAAKFNVNLGAIDVGDASFYLTDDHLVLNLPFLQEALLVKDKDIGKILHQLNDNIDPEAELDFNSFFDGIHALLTEKQKDYIMKEYGDLIFEKLPEEAFTSSKESIEIQDNLINTEKIEFHLSETNVKRLLTLVIDKMSTDEHLKAIIHEILMKYIRPGLKVSSAPSYIKQSINGFLDHYEEILQQIKDDLDLLIMKEGLHSTIWVHKGLIVKRDVSLEIGENEDNLVQIDMEGNQLLNKNLQFFDYDVSVADRFTNNSVNIHASFHTENGKSTDSIILSSENTDALVTYHNEDTLQNNEREFHRSFTFDYGAGEIDTLAWNGVASYEQEEMNANHNFILDLKTIDQSTLEFQLEKTSELIEEVTIIDEPSMDLGAMNEDELFTFLQYELVEQFEQWLFSNIGGGLFDF